MSDFLDAYKTFFESPAGLELLTTITKMIDDNHQKAEDNPDHSRDFMQRAKGNREVLAILNSMKVVIS